MIVGADTIIRDGYLALFRALPGIAVLSPVNNGRVAIAELAVAKPDLIVIDSSVHTRDVDDIIATIRPGIGSALCLVITRSVSRSQEVLRLGAVSAVEEGILPEKLGAEVRRLAMVVRRNKGKP